MLATCHLRPAWFHSIGKPTENDSVSWGAEYLLEAGFRARIGSSESGADARSCPVSGDGKARCEHVSFPCRAARVLPIDAALARIPNNRHFRTCSKTTRSGSGRAARAILHFPGDLSNLINQLGGRERANLSVPCREMFSQFPEAARSKSYQQCAVFRVF
jgi:hypothetical protein